MSLGSKTGRTLADFAVSFRGYRPADAPELMRLVNAILETSHDEQLWDWKYHQNPAGPAVSCVVERDGQIVAHFGALPVQFVINGEERLGVQDVDDVVDPANRTFQGAYHLHKCRCDLHRQAGVDFIYGFAIGVTSQVSQTQHGYGCVARIPRFVKPLDYRPYLTRRASTRLLAPLAIIANAVHKIRFPRSDAPPAGTTLVRVDRFDERFDRFWQQIKGDYLMMVVRDAKYLNWRYVDIPLGSITIYALVENNTQEVLGFVVLGENHDNLPRGRILDIVTPRAADERVASALVAQAVDHFRKRQMALVACWMFPHCHLSRALKSAGFSPKPNKGRDVMFRNTDIDSPAISRDLALDPTNWFLAMGDSDMN